jgi:hypothetical protein
VVVTDKLIEKALAIRHQELAQWEQYVKDSTEDFKEQDELKIAAQWWVDHMDKSCMSPEQVEIFREALVQHTAEMMASAGWDWTISSKSWSFGGTYDYGLEQAGTTAGLLAYLSDADPDPLQWRLPAASTVITKGWVRLKIEGKEAQDLYRA